MAKRQSVNMVANNTKAPPQAKQLIELAKGQEKWHTPEGEAFVSIINEKDGHREHHRIKGTGFKGWLRHRYYRNTDSSCNAAALCDAIATLEGKAIHDGREYPVHVRYAMHEGNIYVDLCDSSWRVVEVTANGWRVREDSPVRFRRSPSMKALAIPARGGSVVELQNELGLNGEALVLAIAWLLSAMRPTGPYPVLILTAEQGSGKTTFVKKLRCLVDPNEADIRKEPNDTRDLLIATQNGWMIALDNLSFLETGLSDDLCRLSTGGGLSTRTLYTDGEEKIFNAKRPIVLTGIEDLATRGDLLERSVLLTLPPIKESDRKTEAEIWESFYEAWPRLFGVLLDALSTALRRVPNIKIERLPRMADFALWATAAETALGWSDGTFMTVYAGNRASGHELAIEASPIGKALIDFMDGKPYWTGTATDLLEGLNGTVGDDEVKRQRGWPKQANHLSGKLKRLAPNLRSVGIDIIPDRTSAKKIITIEKVPKNIVTTVMAVTDTETTGNSSFLGDDGMTMNSDSVTMENPIDDEGDDDDDEKPAYSDNGLSPEDFEAVDQFLNS